MPDLRDLKVGDSVFVVWQRDRHDMRRGAPARCETIPIVKCGRKYYYVRWFSDDLPFDPATGMSVHKECNTRANGLGFDVHRSKQEYRDEQHREAERDRLCDRLGVEKYDCRRLERVTDDQIAAMHVILDGSKEGE